MAIVELENVSKRYPAPGGDDGPWVLRDVSLTVAEGESLAIVGPSGSGKSTLLNIIGALDTPTSGAARLGGMELSALSADELAGVRAGSVGFVFQLHHLLAQCTALENVLVPTLAAGADADGAPERARALLQRVGLADRMDYRPAQLSGGERQRVAAARALINSPPLVLADEPTGNLDHESAEELADLLIELNAAEGAALIVATHSAELAGRMGRTLQLRDGQLRES